MKATVFLADMEGFEAYLEYVEGPARSTVEVSDLAAAFDVEIEVIVTV